MSTTNSYSVPADNKVSGAPFTASVSASPGAPTVTGVTVEGRPQGGVSVGQVTVHFDPAHVHPDSPPQAPFSFDVTCEARDANGIRLAVTDGDDRLTTMADIDADYDLHHEADANRWAGVTHMDVRVTVGTPN